ncbi:alpha-L-fucosidase [Mucilaginibacter ginsenosidivorax]|uniref:alpha-L-fucosidase n=1 Tax=Mucilaginibacter ginsenosidivorax TaxID=862126 RepID=A0A5B8W3C4_9SPHI|nr:alpha-L-fucosidase [Mucilaginibacter ginsenosidivorax]QEC78560.1 alpha-L-fucosidase [Mucilaginibacter ginsenosidivorax]
MFKALFRKLIFGSALILCASKLDAQERFQADWQSLKKYQIPEWFRDAKFGIFIHWGVYAVPAYKYEWYPRHMYNQGSDEYQHQVATYGPENKFGYKDFIPMFKAEKFDADAWVALFKKAGARYVVPVAEHHDGFAMYKTSLSKWNAAEMGPKRDIIGELAAAVRKSGLIFGLSSHRIEHWWFMGEGTKFDSDVKDPAYADFYGPAKVYDPFSKKADNVRPIMSPEFMNDWLMRNIELADKYKPQLFWFDWWIEQPELEPYRKSFASYYYNKGLEWDKGVVLNYKNETAFPEGTAVFDMERGKLAGIHELAWQTDDAIGNQSWGYAEGNTFKTAQYVIANLVDIVSKNGNLLLNIGPRADGTITDEETQVLLGTGQWLSVNGEAIYGTRPWKVYGEGPTVSASGQFGDQKIPFTSKDIRFTVKGNTLYAITLALPAVNEVVTIKSLGAAAGNGAVASVELVGSKGRLSWKQSNKALTITNPGSFPAGNAAAFSITFKK